MHDRDFPPLICGDLYKWNEEKYNVFGLAIHHDTGEALVILANSADEVLAVPAVKFFSMNDDGKYVFEKLECRGG